MQAGNSRRNFNATAPQEKRRRPLHHLDGDSVPTATWRLENFTAMPTHMSEHKQIAEILLATIFTPVYAILHCAVQHHITRPPFRSPAPAT